jgi:hypothetical protein
MNIPLMVQDLCQSRPGSSFGSDWGANRAPKNRQFAATALAATPRRPPTAIPKPKSAFGGAKFRELHTCLLALSPLEPRPRGFAFEKFLTRLFNGFSFEAGGSFRLIGEQMDGSFLLGGQTKT